MNRFRIIDEVSIYLLDRNNHLTLRNKHTENQGFHLYVTTMITRQWHGHFIMLVEQLKINEEI